LKKVRIEENIWEKEKEIGNDNLKKVF